MHSAQSKCLTRVVVDDANVEIAQMHHVMHRIQEALCEIPHAQREYVANALLNLAVARMVKEEGQARAMTILRWLGDVGSTEPVRRRSVLSISAAAATDRL